MSWDNLGMEKPTRTPEEIRAEQMRQWKPLTKAPLGTELAEVLHAQNAITPNGEKLRALGRRLSAFAASGEFEVVAPVCPDYAWRDIGGKPTYTFDGLGGGIGIVSGRSLDVKTELAKLLKERGGSIRFRMLIADQEATPETCSRVGLTREEFLGKLDESCKAIRAEATSRGFEIDCSYLTKSGRAPWEDLMKRAADLIGSIDAHKIDHIARQRGPLLSKWAGVQLSSAEARAKVVAQGTEYVAAGLALSGDNRLILDLGASVMSIFTQHGAGDTPVLSFKRPEY